MARTRQHPITKQIADLKHSLASLCDTLSELAGTAFGSTAPARSIAKAPRRASRQLSPKARAALQLQGRYMGFMRQLSAKNQAAVRGVKEKKGMEAAIGTAQKLAGKSKAA